MKWLLSQLDNRFERADFDGGQPKLNEYLKKYALQNMKKGYAMTFVATGSDSQKVVGYYSVSASNKESRIE